MFRLNCLLFTAVIFLFGIISQGIVSATSCEVICEEPDFFVHGLCFAPYEDGQDFNSEISIEQIRERLGFINRKPHTEWIRTYAATKGLELIPGVAKELGMKVAMGTWVRDNKEDEIENLITAACAGLVDIAIIGNEELYAGVVDANELLDFIDEVRFRLADCNRSDILVAIAETEEIKSFL
jgi:exo-beta-1,3-glucanase (GH17 family)